MLYKGIHLLDLDSDYLWYIVLLNYSSAESIIIACFVFSCYKQSSGTTDTEKQLHVLEAENDALKVKLREHEARNNDLAEQQAKCADLEAKIEVSSTNFHFSCHFCHHS